MIALLGARTGAAATPQRDAESARSLFIQSGIAEADVHSVAAGITWQWDWRRRYRLFTLTGYSELVVGQWTSKVEKDSHTVTQIGFTPVLRLQPRNAWSAWFAEVGIGANVITPRYRTDSKEFSTEFNFGDHIGVGRVFGRDANREVALRLQHFSNGGIESPNPGENFLQLRYSQQF